MDKMADVLGRAGAWCGQNKYLSAIKNAFQNFMPLTIAGAIGVLWCNVLVNDQTGLGLFFKPIMALDFLNPAFQAVNFCTISCITVGITLGIAQEIGVWNMGAEKAGYIPGLVGLAAWLSVTNTSHMVEGAKALKNLKKNDKVLISEACTHHSQPDDIGKVKIPRWIRENIDNDIVFEFSNGKDFPKNLEDYKLVIHCGACTLNRKEMLSRIESSVERGVPIINYGLTIAYLHGIFERALKVFPNVYNLWIED